MDAELSNLTVQLGAALARNTATSIADRVQVARARRANEETIEQLVEVINELIADKSELALIAQSYEQQLAGQKITQEDVSYIAEKVVPLVREFVATAYDAGSGSGADEETGETIESLIGAIESLLSVETFNILQLVGFNFKQAIGDPLTTLISQAILSKAPETSAHAVEVEALRLRKEVAFLEAMQDPEARARLSIGASETAQ